MGLLPLAPEASASASSATSALGRKNCRQEQTVYPLSPFAGPQDPRDRPTNRHLTRVLVEISIRQRMAEEHTGEPLCQPASHPVIGGAMALRSVTVMAVVVGFAGAAALRAASGEWADVRGLPRGCPITVTVRGSALKVEFQRASETSLVVLRSGTATSLDRGDIDRLTYFAPRRTRFAHTRLIIGLLIGIPLGAPSGQGTGNARGIPIMMAIGGGLGAWGDHKHRQNAIPQEIVVYER